MPDISKSLTDSVDMYNKVIINDEILNSLSMSEREAVVYSLINVGASLEGKKDVQIEELFNLN